MGFQSLLPYMKLKSILRKKLSFQTTMVNSPFQILQLQTETVGVGVDYILKQTLLLSYVNYVVLMLTSNFKHNFHKKKKVFCIKARSTSALHSHEGKDTKPTTVKWSITKQGVQEHNLCYLWIDERRPLHNTIASNTLHYIFALVVKDSREVRCVRVWSFCFFSSCQSMGCQKRTQHSQAQRAQGIYLFLFQFRGYNIILQELCKSVIAWDRCFLRNLRLKFSGMGMHASIKKTAFHNTGACNSHVGQGQSLWHFQAIYSHILRAEKV